MTAAEVEAQTVTKETDQSRLELAQQLVMALETGDETGAGNLIEQLSEQQGRHDDELFQEVGRLTRELHEAINGFLLDMRVTEMVEVDMPDAAERLRYVIDMTEQAANTTLNAVEEAMPLAERLQDNATRLNGQWDKFVQRELMLDEFKTLSTDIHDFLAQAGKDSVELHDKMNEILMAQGFQDITGQIIRKVITLVQDVESRLVQLVKLAGTQRSEKEQDEMRRKHRELEDGPAVPGVTQSEVVSGQDDVDDLLSSLGF